MLLWFLCCMYVTFLEILSAAGNTHRLQESRNWLKASADFSRCNYPILLMAQKLVLLMEKTTSGQSGANHLWNVFKRETCNNQMERAIRADTSHYFSFALDEHTFLSWILERFVSQSSNEKSKTQTFMRSGGRMILELLNTEKWKWKETFRFINTVTFSLNLSKLLFDRDRRGLFVWINYLSVFTK